MTKVLIETPEGTVELDVAALKVYKNEAFTILGEEAKAKKDFKEAMEAQAEALGIGKKEWSKYIKTAFKEQTKEQSVLGELFAQLDEATEEVLQVSGN